MARMRTQTYQIQRDYILAKAAALFAQRGYTATSMNEVADACGVSKPALYHYVQDKHDLLVRICERHIARLVQVVEEVEAQGLAPQQRVCVMVQRFVAEYAEAQNEHRVLTEDVKFLETDDQQRVLDGERRVVKAVAQALSELRPELQQAQLVKPLTMLLFGMINWMFTWLRPGGALTHAAVAPMVTDLFFGGIDAIRAAEPPAST